MFFIQKEYLKYLCHSTNHHGVHSPFIYNFITKCIYAKSNVSQKNKFNKYRQSLFLSNEKILVEDFGAGSQVFKGAKRSVSKVAKVAGIQKKYGLLLMRMMEYFEINTCLEIGTSLGMASFCMVRNKKNNQLFTLEGCENTLNVAKKNLFSQGLNNINFIQGKFEDTLSDVVKNRTFDFVYFDGNHTKEATLYYFKECLKSKHNDSIFVFDDIHWSKGMLLAWEEIKNHPEVTVTMDLFQWGIVFFRKEQRKEHFIIRY